MLDTVAWSAILNDLLLNADKFLFNIYEVFYKTGSGNIPVFGGLPVLTTMTLVPLSWMIGMHFIQGVFEWIRSKKVNPQHVGEIIKCLGFIGLMLLFSRWGKLEGSSMSGIQSGSVGTVSIQSLLKQVDNSRERAVMAVSTLDIIAIYEEQLQNKAVVGNARYKKVLENISKKNPRLKALLEAREQAAAAQGKPGGMTFYDRMSTTMKTSTNAVLSSLNLLKDMASTPGGMATSALKVMLGVFGKAVVYIFYKLLIFVSYLLFTISVFKAIIGFAIYLKIAVILALILVPPSIGLAYFVPLRGIAMNLIKQILVLIMLVAAFGKVYEAIFNETLLNQVIAQALSAGAGGSIAKAAHNDDSIDEVEEMVVTVEAITGADRMGANPDEVDSVAYFATLDTGQIRAVFLAVSRAVMMLGLMVILVGRITEMISNSLDGAYDPTDLLRRQAMETQQTMGTGGGQ